MTTYHRRRWLALLPFALGALLTLLAFAGGAPAQTGGMSGKQGMMDEEMRGGMHERMEGMQTPGTAGATDNAHGVAPATDGHGAEGVDGSHAGMGGASGAAPVNWIVIGGFAVLVAGSTLAAVATKRHLRRRMLTGELAAAGVQDV